MAKANAKKTKKILLIGLLAILTAAILVSVFFWNRYLNKNNLLHKYTADNQEIYMLGTIHDNHFNKYFNFSIEDILSAVKNVQPDVVFIEAREEYFVEYGAVDGPVEMSVLYSYCVENNIPTEMIDWWVVDNEYQSNTTSNRRDDMIFANINNKLSCLDNDSRVLVVCGVGHLYEQSERFLKSENGYKREPIKHAASFFESNAEFTYPSFSEQVWDDRAYFYAYTYPDIIENTDGLDAEIKSQFVGGNPDAFYKQQLEYCDLFSKDELYK